MDIYTKDGKKIAHLLHYLPEVRDGDIILVQTGREFGLTQTERNTLSDTIRLRANNRAKVIVVDESTTVETTTQEGLRAARRT